MADLSALQGAQAGRGGTRQGRRLTQDAQRVTGKAAPSRASIQDCVHPELERRVVAERPCEAFLEAPQSTNGQSLLSAIGSARCGRKGRYTRLTRRISRPRAHTQIIRPPSAGQDSLGALDVRQLVVVQLQHLKVVAYAREGVQLCRVVR